MTPQISNPVNKREIYLRLARDHYENFPVGSVLVPARLRPHIHRIYAFARTADDIADELQDAELLASYRADFAAHLDGGVTEPLPLFVDLEQTIRALDLPRTAFFALLDAFEQDLHVRRYEEAELFDYCTRSADPVGRLVLRVFGIRDARADHLSDRICTGLQLLNHLQDIRSDLADRDRIYFPVADLQRFGVTEADLGCGQATPAVLELVRHWWQRTVDLLREGWGLIGLVSGRLALELRAIVRGAAAVLDAIAARGFDVLAEPIRLSRAAKLRVLVAAITSSRPPKVLR